MHISKSPEKDKKAFALRLLAKIGIDEDTAKRKVLKLSGGEQQRVGIARALAMIPKSLLRTSPPAIWTAIQKRASWTSSQSWRMSRTSA